MYPDSASVHLQEGLALHKLGAFHEAIAHYDQALAIKPDYVTALYNRGNALREIGENARALEAYEAALALKPDSIKILNNYGITLHGMWRYEEALASYDRALCLQPDYIDALNNRGNVLLDLRRHEDALANYHRLLAIQPDCAEAHFQEGLCRLLMGDWTEGWKKYEWRWKNKRLGHVEHSFAQPLWLGQTPLKGKTILLHAEQGLGDVIQFCRYASCVAEQGARVVLAVHSPLKSLLAKLDGVVQIVAEGEALPAFDLHCPLLSMPLAFKTELTSIPASQAYLVAEDSLVQKWQKKLGEKKKKRVGIVWSGGVGQCGTPERSIPLSLFIKYGQADVEFVCLQKEVRASDQSLLAERRDIRYFGHELADFADTAALISLMDSVVSIDTAVAHLAGALGKPVSILLLFNADWRWLLYRNDSPWYGSARLYRQPRVGDWESVLAQVADMMQHTT